MKKLRIAGFTAMFFLLLFSLGLCADAGFRSFEEFGEWMTFYYSSPTPEKVPVALEYFTDSDMYKTNVTMPMVAFFSALFKRDVVTMKKTFDEVSRNGSEESKIMFINILSLANTPEGRELLEKAKGSWGSERLQTVIARKISGLHEDLYTMPVDSPQMLDMLWASFCATGDDLPVRRIISVLHLQQDGNGEEIIVGGAANWSLKSNAQMHPRVLDICKQELVLAQEPTKTLLEEAIK
jgi:hypothetical protein